ncbi:MULTISPECIES: dihydroorotase [Dehalococcoides]|uniref:Dihydroorotase n=2 Tax=root TaxID=1 RepID=A0AB33HQZ9_9CHLR|nr:MULTISPECIES: dihydroorotase [Dehalococcoides]MEA4879005.1 dihydroorotase [Dehalococcoides mccartyi]POZ59616.1 Dihydroorotase [Dehalococcoides mccartyi]BAZ97614.1 dihydroorotase [Dehalococcoides mccartyi]
MKILIKNGRIIDPAEGTDKVADLLLENGLVAGINSNIPSDKADEVIDAEGKVVCPGFIDLHVHLREPGFEGKETIESGCKAAAAGGFTTICPMPNTNPAADNLPVIDFVKNTAAKVSPIRVLPIAAITKGRKGQELSPMGELAEAGVAGFSDDGDYVSNSSMLLHALLYSRTFGLPVMEHCEDACLAEGGAMNEGLLACRLGLKGIPDAAEEIALSRDIALAKESGGRLHLCHISTAGSVELVRRAKAAGIQVSAEVTPHHLTLTEAEVSGYNTNAKVNPPLRTQSDIEALITGLKDGTIDAIATDHAPHTANDKLCEFGLAANGISGLETAFASLMGLVHSGSISLSLLIEKLTLGPRQVLGEKHKNIGNLKPGSSADVVIFDPDEEWTVDTARFFSKGKNTPLEGRRLKGRVKTTIACGRIAYRE